MSGNLLQILKLLVNLKSAILKCNAVIPKGVIGELSVVFNLVVVGCIGVLKLPLKFLYVEYLRSEIAVPESIRALYHLPAWTIIVGQSVIYATVIVSSVLGPSFMGCTTERGLH